MKIPAIIYIYIHTCIPFFKSKSQSKQLIINEADVRSSQEESRSEFLTCTNIIEPTCRTGAPRCPRWKIAFLQVNQSVVPNVKRESTTTLTMNYPPTTVHYFRLYTLVTLEKISLENLRITQEFAQLSSFTSRHSAIIA